MHIQVQSNIGNIKDKTRASKPSYTNLNNLSDHQSIKSERILPSLP